jgi:hypothetical protein
VSRWAGDGLVIMRAAITPGREGLFGSVFEASGAREALGSGGRDRGFTAPGPEHAQACCYPRYRCPPPYGESPLASPVTAASAGRAGQLGAGAPCPRLSGVGGHPPQPGWGQGATQPTRSPRDPHMELLAQKHQRPVMRVRRAGAERRNGAGRIYGSGAAQGALVGSTGAERRNGAGRTQGRDRQEAGSPRAGPGATGFGWAPPYLRSRLA